MTTSNKTIFPSEFSVHLDIKYHVASDLLVSREELTTPNLFQSVSPFLKVYPHINHLLLNGVFTKFIPHGLINIQGFFTVLGTLIPNLWVFRQYLVLTLEIIRSRRLSTCLTHHLNTGSSSNWLATAYSASSTGLECFKSTKVTHLEDPPFHSTYKLQPLVVFFVCTFPDFLVRNPLALLISDVSLW